MRFLLSPRNHSIDKKINKINTIYNLQFLCILILISTSEIGHYDHYPFEGIFKIHQQGIAFKECPEQITVL